MVLTLAALIASITVFVLAIFLGFELISKVPPTLHTPLMSGANAISGITIAGGMLQAGNGDAGELAQPLGAIAILVVCINIVGGFLWTHRMPAMFRKYGWHTYD